MPDSLEPKLHEWRSHNQAGSQVASGAGHGPGWVPDTHNDVATELASLNNAQNNSGTKMLKDKAVSFGTL